MQHSLHHQAGYLAIVIAILMVTVAFSSLVISYEFSNKALSVNNSLSSMQSYYLALSGIERATYDITVNNIGCTAINGTANYTNATYPNAAGTFTVTAASTTATSSLNAALTASSATISLISSIGFASTGTVQIDNELINYTSNSSNTLTGLTRGAGGSTAASHDSGASVSQNQCLLTSNGGVPNLTSSNTKRVIQETLIGSSFSIGGSGAGTGSGSSLGAGSGLTTAAMAIAGSVFIGSGTNVVNSSVTSSSPNFSGSTIASGGPVILNGTGQTDISNGSGSLTISSTASSMKADISQNNSSIMSNGLWSNFFSSSKTTVQASSNQSYNSLNINGAAGQIIWTSSLGFLLPTTIGTSTNPVILIVNGSLSSFTSLTVNGLVYVMGSVSLNGVTVINGLFATEGALSTSGTTTINYNPGILSLSAGLNSNSTTAYSIIPSNVQEQYA